MQLISAQWGPELTSGVVLASSTALLDLACVHGLAGSYVCLLALTVMLHACVEFRAQWCSPVLSLSLVLLSWLLNVCHLDGPAKHLVNVIAFAHGKLPCL